MPNYSIANPEIRKIHRRQAVNQAHIAPQTRHPDVFETSVCGSITAATSTEDQWLAKTSNGWAIQVLSFRQNCLRLRFAPSGVFDDTPTYALPEGTHPEGKLNLQETDDHWRFTTAAGCLVLAKADGKYYTENATGLKTLEAENAPTYVSSIMSGTVEIGNSFLIEEDEAFHGLGDKPGNLDMRGRRYTMWNTDAFGYSNASDEIYKSIPFLIAERGDRRIGLLFDNTHRASFDFGKENEDKLTYAAEGGELTIFFFFGDDPVGICSDYCKLTGTPPMPPMWALGYQQCRWSYYPESRVREVVDTFRKLEIPCDAIYLDIDYMDSYKCFTWTERLFPDLKKMIADFRDAGMRTVVMIDPGISAVDGYHVYESGTKENAWCRRTNGEVMVGPVWPEKCVFPDFTKASVRDWWGKLYKELYNDIGVSGFWNDMNEPAVFKVDRATFPDEVFHDMDGHFGTHDRAHNIYGLKMTEASFEGLRDLQPEVRPFLLTRATYAGGQRYAAVWTGDNTASWKHLEVANHQCIRLSLCGFSLTGSDIGGFYKDPDGELYTRWIQLAIFHPVMRTHSMGSNADGSTQTDQEAVMQSDATNRRDQEPWSYGDTYTHWTREAINWRYRLLPSLYTAVENLHRTGRPVLIPSYMYDPSDKQLVSKNAFLFAENFFVDPVLKQGSKAKEIYLPKGTWYLLQNGTPLQGQTKVQLDTADMGVIPCFVRGGAVIQLDPVRQSTSQPYEQAPELHVYHAEGKHISQLYLDAGEGYSFEQGNYLRSAFTYEGKEDASTLTVTQTGDYQPAFESYQLIWHGSGEGAWKLYLDGIEHEVTAENDTYKANIPVRFSSLAMRKI